MRKLCRDSRQTGRPCLVLDRDGGRVYVGRGAQPDREAFRFEVSRRLGHSQSVWQFWTRAGVHVS